MAGRKPSRPRLRGQQRGAPRPPVEAGEPPKQRTGIFVMQKHDARTLHYDFRLEVEGVLKSWALPKGPSLNPRDKRLAVPTEDHPLEYAAFEGVVPEQQYGAGPVIVWDGGTYRNLKLDQDGNEVPMDDAIEQGHVTVWLAGKKLRGGFALTRMRVVRGRQQWLLVKMRDSFADQTQDVLQAQPCSILSGLTIEELAERLGSRS